MKKYIALYLEDIETKLQNHKLTIKDIEIFKEKIIIFEHERLIHLLVTLFYALFTFIFFAFSLISPIFLIPFIFGIIFLLFYIPYYFYLEKKVQKMYYLYDEMLKL